MMLQKYVDREMFVDSIGLPALLALPDGRANPPAGAGEVIPYHFCPDAFATDQMQDFLRTRNTRDEILYGPLDRGRRGPI